MLAPKPLSRTRAVALAVVLPLLACGLQWWVRPQVPGTLWLLFYPAVYVSCWLGGLVPGVTSTVLSIALGWTFFIPNTATPQGGALATAIFAAMCALFCLTHERWRRNELRLRVLFAKSADAIIVADLNGRCEGLNQAACTLLDAPRDRFKGRSIFDWVLPEHVERLRLALDAIRRGGIERLELTLLTPRGEQRPVELSTNALPDDVWLINLRDIRPRKEAEEALLQMRAELYEAQRLGKIGNWRWNPRTQEAIWSPELYRIYQLDPNQPPPSIAELEKMYTRESQLARDAAIQEALKTGRPYEAERELVLANGERRWIVVTVEGVRSPDGSIGELRGTAQDITERKRIELALIESRKAVRDMAAHREQEREDERKAIAREIHDELGQLLAAMRMDVAQLRMKCPEGGTTPALQDLSKLVERTIEVMRSLATSLRPSALDLGLLAALEWLTEDFSLRWEIPCTLLVAGEERALDDARATAIFRVVQESLTNVAKHAQANHVSVSVDFAPAGVRVAIRDDGQGFDSSSPPPPGHFGLMGMQERIHALQGEIQIDSQPGRGSHITIKVPTPDSART